MPLPYFPGTLRPVVATADGKISDGPCRVWFMSWSCNTNASAVRLRHGTVIGADVKAQYDCQGQAATTLYKIKGPIDFKDGLFLDIFGTGISHVNFTMEG